MKSNKPQNKTIVQIFAPEKLSSRFHLYQNDCSRKGKALYLCQILMLIKNEFPEFGSELSKLITEIQLDIDKDQPAEQEKRILKAMRNFATTIIEIAQETKLDWWITRDTLELLVKQGKASKHDHPLSEDYRDQLYFLENNS